ncbi:MAG: YrzE family protein [Actinomycetota bacterium]|nr:YrzE family protein [Actinomycetota bacterium]
MPQDDPRREPDPVTPGWKPEPDPGIRPDGYLVEPPLPEQALTSEPVQPRMPTDDTMGWPDHPDGTEEPERRRVVILPRGRYLGIVAFILAALLFGANVVGIVLSNTGSDEAALAIAYVTIFSTILTFLGGFLAAVLNFGRVWGIGAVVLSVLANPFVLVVLLGSFTGAVR